MIYVVFCSSFVHLLLHLCLVSNCEELFFILFLFIFCFGFVVSSPCCPQIPCVAEGGGDGLGLVYQTKLMHSSCNSFFKCWCACVRYLCECEKDVSVVACDSFQELENVFCIFFREGFCWRMSSALFRSGFWLFLFSASCLGSCLVMSCFCVCFPRLRTLALQLLKGVLGI